ncbi:MAG: hypothetical protein VX899_03410, partial [Myxococcota bacterium]|nr:hypothetical protein [Myxococcota bacterium]
MLPLLLTLAARADTGDTGACSDPDLTWVEGSCVSNYGAEPICGDGRFWVPGHTPGWNGSAGIVACAPGSDIAYIFWREEPG